MPRWLLLIAIPGALVACTERGRTSAREERATAPPSGAIDGVVPATTPNDEKPRPPASLLLMATGKDQAQALVRFHGSKAEILEGPKPGLAIDESLRTARAVASPGKTVRLSGSVRSQCVDELFVHVPGLDDSRALYVAGRHALRPRTVSEVEPSREVRERVARLVDLAAGQAPAIDEARAVDLDGDGKEEIVVVSAAEMQEGADHAYSVLVVLPPSGEPAAVGFRRARDGDDAAHLIELSGIADIDGDGAMEILALHTAPWVHHHRLVVYAWKRGTLQPLSENVWAERDCYPDDDWP